MQVKNRRRPILNDLDNDVAASQFRSGDPLSGHDLALVERAQCFREMNSTLHVPYVWMTTNLVLLPKIPAPQKSTGKLSQNEVQFFLSTGEFLNNTPFNYSANARFFNTY